MLVVLLVVSKKNNIFAENFKTPYIMYDHAQVKIIWKPRKKDNNGELSDSLKLRVTYNRDNRIYATRSHEKLTKDEYQSMNKKKTREAYTIANEDLQIAENICHELGSQFTFTEFRLRYENMRDGKPKRKNIDFSWKKFLMDYQNFKQIKQNTIESYQTVIHWICRFQKNATISDVTTDFIKNLVSFIKETYKKEHARDISVNTLGIYNRSLKAMCNYATTTHLLNESPVFAKINTAPREKRALPVEEWNKFCTYKPTTEKEQFAQSFAMLSFLFCGANCADILALKNENIINNEVHFVRQKTERSGGEVVFALSDKAKKIIKEYGNINSKNPNNYIFPFYNIRMTEKQQNNKRNDIIKKINDGIKTICKNLNISPFTTYNIRHTFAIYSLEHIKVHELSKMLGHKNISTTEIYINSITPELKQKTLSYVDSMVPDGK